MAVDLRLARALLVAGALGHGLSAAWAGPQAVAGLVRVRENGMAQLHFMAQPPADQPVFVQLPSRGGKAQCCTRVPFSALKPLAQPNEAVTGPAGEAAFSYAMDHPLPGRFGLGGFIGVAMSAPEVAAAGKGVAAVMPKTQQRTQAHLCQGQEGVNLIARRGHRVQLLYLGFGYEAEAESSSACTASDLKLIEQAGD